MNVELKINGQSIIINTDKLHESWIAHCLAYGLRRFPNDKYSGEKGQTKFDLVHALVVDMHSGDAMPERVKGVSRAPKDPILNLALKTAKTDLGAMFRKVTSATKTIDWCKHEKVAQFFKVDGDKAIWIDAVVVKWMESRKETCDYMANAKVSIDAADAIDVALDF